MAASKSDYYDILGVSKGASAGDLKKAYRKQALEWHPDRHQGEDKVAAEKRFKEINEAYQVLSDPQKKAAYDQYGHDAFTPGGATSGNPFAGGRQGPFTYSYSTGGGPSSAQGFGGQSSQFSDFGDPFDIFEAFFGGGNPFGGQRARQIPRYSIEIEFMEAAKGVEKEVSIEGKRRKIKIPAGVNEGSRINFTDFILSINIRPHDIFERDGEDVYVKVGIPYSLAVMGGEIKVPTIDGDLKLKIRAGTQPGTMMRLRERGIQRLQSRSRGDEYVRINIAVPERLSREQKRVIEEMESEGL
jgi:DnaJ-class molecular chaperone